MNPIIDPAACLSTGIVDSEGLSIQRVGTMGGGIS
jgi:hypothetical protein